MDLEDTALSFQEWSDAGYKILKGSKSPHRDIMGVPQFTADQVVRAGSQRGARTHWEECAAKAKSKGTPWGVVEDFDSFVREAGMSPDLNRRTVFAISNPLEQHFMNVADKHGILDAILDGHEDDYY